MDDLSRFCCLNSGCPEHGKRGAGNLTVTSRYGPRKGRRMLRCSACKARFSERKGTPLFDSRLPPGKVESVLEHIAEGCGVRQTGRRDRRAPQRWPGGGRSLVAFALAPGNVAALGHRLMGPPEARPAQRESAGVRIRRTHQQQAAHLGHREGHQGALAPPLTPQRRSSPALGRTRRPGRRGPAGTA